MRHRCLPLAGWERDRRRLSVRFWAESIESIKCVEYTRGMTNARYDKLAVLLEPLKWLSKKMAANKPDDAYDAKSAFRS
jgi:hypothetical protein